MNAATRLQIVRNAEKQRERIAVVECCDGLVVGITGALPVRQIAQNLEVDVEELLRHGSVGNDEFTAITGRVGEIPHAKEGCEKVVL